MRSSWAPVFLLSETRTQGWDRAPARKVTVIASTREPFARLSCPRVELLGAVPGPVTPHTVSFCVCHCPPHPRKK